MLNKAQKKKQIDQYRPEIAFKLEKKIVHGQPVDVKIFDSIKMAFHKEAFPTQLQAVSIDITVYEEKITVHKGGHFYEKKRRQAND